MLVDLQSGMSGGVCGLLTRQFDGESSIYDETVGNLYAQRHDRR